MKNMILFVLSFSLVACGGSASDAEGEDQTNYPEGKSVYERTCVACHQADGKGLSGSFPPLAKADYMLDDINRAIEQVLNGSSGEITVNGEVFNGIMPPQSLTDQEVVDVLNYCFNSWGNSNGEITLDQVKKAKHP